MYRAKEEKTGVWRIGYFTRKKSGGLIEPVIEVEYESDSEDYIESYIIDGNTLGILVCKDKNNKNVWSNSKVIYNNLVYDLIYNINGYYINDGISSNFDENEIEVICD